jgi:hypothetical protein
MMTILMLFLLNTSPVWSSGIDTVVTQDKVRELLNSFVQQTTPNRVPGELGSKKARTFLKDYLKRHESKGQRDVLVQSFLPAIQVAQKMYLDDFENQVAKKFKPEDPVYTHWKKFTEHTLGLLDQFKEVPGENIIFFLKGQGPGQSEARQTVYLFANYDTIIKDEEGRPKIGGTMPGADDNATGVVTLLLAAEYFSKNPPPYNLALIFFDFQELAFMGARAFLGSRQELKIPAPDFFVSALMLGHDSSFYDKGKATKNMKVYLRQSNRDDKVLWDSMRPKVEAASGTPKLFSPMANNFDMGDHTIFWQSNLPGVVFSQDWEDDLNPKQHTANDLPESLNYETLTLAIRGIIGGLGAF